MTPKVHDGWMWDLTVPGNNDHDFYVMSVQSASSRTYDPGTDGTPILVHNDDGCGYTDLYHATNSTGATSIRANGVDPSYGPRPMDFGNGFYTTRSEAQAVDWATRRFGDDGVVLHFRIPNDHLAALNSKVFSADSSDLSDFVRSFRSGNGTEVPPYDMVEGPMLRNPGPFGRGAAPVWFGNQVVFFGDTGPMLDGALQGG